MSTNVKDSKIAIGRTINNFQNLYKRRPNSFISRVFFDAKANEITDIFSSGPSVKITDLVSTLNKVAPIHSKKWQKIKF
jgi:hypothetical protein